MTARRLLGGGPGNRRDRERFAALEPARQIVVADDAERLYDGTRTVARCWTEALDNAARLCPCGKPAEHVHADPDSPEWPCRVPESERVSQDPDGLDCYSDHENDIRQRGECSWCTSSDPKIVGHVLPDVPRFKRLDPVDAARTVDERGVAIFDGVLLDAYTARHIVVVHDALTTEAARAKLRAMSLPKAADVCFKLVAKFGKSA